MASSTTSRMMIRSLSRRGTLGLGLGLGLGLDVPRRIRPRMLSGTSNTRPLYAQPSQYVAGVTMEQLENDPSLREYFDANFGNWREAPETLTVSAKEKEEEEAPSAADDEDDAANATNPHGIILPPSLASRNIRPLVAYLRDPAREEGSRSCRRLRSDPLLPLIPGILHGSDPTASPPLFSHEASSKLLVKTPWFEIQREIDRHHYDHFTSRVYALTVFRAEDAHVGYHKSLQNSSKRSERQLSYHVDQDAMTVTSTRTPSALDVEIANLPENRTPVLENVLVIPSDLQLHPVAHSAFCLNYRRYHPTKPIRLPLRPINEEESPAIKRGGFLLMVNKFVECLVEEGAVVPEFVGVECAGLRAKDVVRGGRLVVPEGVRVSPRVGNVEGFLVGTVFGVRGKGGAGDD